MDGTFAFTAETNLIVCGRLHSSPLTGTLEGQPAVWDQTLSVLTQNLSLLVLKKSFEEVASVNRQFELFQGTPLTFQPIPESVSTTNSSARLDATIVSRIRARVIATKSLRFASDVHSSKATPVSTMQSAACPLKR